MQAEVEVVLYAGRREDRHRRRDEGLLGLVGDGGGAGRMVIAGDGDDTAESRAACAVGMPEDIAAAAWVNEHVSEDALFMANTFWFDFLPDFIIASDAGGWLPVLAGRATIVPPMIYPVERTAEPDFNKRLVALAQIAPDMTSPAAINLLRSAGITYIFIGQRGGRIDPAHLLVSPDYTLEYHAANTYVFRLLDDTAGD